MKRATLGFLVSLALASAGCAADKSFALVSVLSTAGQFNGVTQLVVDVMNSTDQDHLTYPKMPAAATAAFRFDEATPLTFSVGFKTSHRGTLSIAVTPLDATGAVMGYGVGMAEILADTVTNVTVRVMAGAKPPVTADGGVDGGKTGDGARGDGGAGVEAGPPCEPVSATSCGANRACYVSCRQDQPAVTMCIAAGTKKAGEACTNANECAPGTQCLELPCSAGRPKLMTCVQLCKSDSDCGEGKCNDSLCMTQVRVCSRPCDPLDMATSGCAAGLNCLLGANEVPSCYCNPDEGIGEDGAACTTSNNCKPGFLCVTMAGASKCRKLCRLADKDKPGACPAGSSCTMLVSPNYTTFGGCIP